MPRQSLRLPQGLLAPLHWIARRRKTPDHAEVEATPSTILGLEVRESNWDEWIQTCVEWYRLPHSAAAQSAAQSSMPAAEPTVAAAAAAPVGLESQWPEGLVSAPPRIIGNNTHIV